MGRYVVGYQSCDNSTVQTGDYEQRRCAANARAYAEAKPVVAVIGPTTSFCASVQIGILNRSAGGPLAMISPSASKPNLTRGGRLADPNWALRDALAHYYPTRVRNFFRLTARDDQEGTALAMLARRLRLRAVYVVYDPATLGPASFAAPFRRQATRTGIRVAGYTAYDAAATSYRALAGKVARSGADGVLIAGVLSSGGDRVLTDLRARLGPRIAIMTGHEIPSVGGMLTRSGDAARGLYFTDERLLPATLDKTPARERFTHDFGPAADGPYALQTAQAVETVLHAIGRSDGTRASVLRRLAETRVKDGILGSFDFDRHGDITPARITVLRITGSTPPGLNLPWDLQGAIVEDVETVPASG